MGDCERFHDGIVAEPVNALSSVAYIAAGAYVWRHNRPAGAALIAVGVGSLAYHGPGGTFARVLHDGAIVVLVAIVVIASPRIARAFRAHPAVGALALLALAIAAALQMFGRTGGAWCRPDGVLQAHAGWHILTAFALALAFAGATRLSRDPSGARPRPPTSFEPANR